MWYIIYNLLTESWRIESSPAINDTVISSNDSPIDAITNEQEILLMLRNNHVFFVNSFSCIDNKIPIFGLGVIGRKCNGIPDCCEIISPMWAHYHTLVYKNSIALHFTKISFSFVAIMARCLSYILQMKKLFHLKKNAIAKVFANISPYLIFYIRKKKSL